MVGQGIAMTEARRGWLWETGWLLLWIGLSSVWCVSASTRLSATFDEPTYIRCGLESWRSGSNRELLDLGTMPLPPHVQTLPLRFWERWRGQAFDADRDLSQLLPVARLGTLPFWWLLLGYSYACARRLAGPRAAAVALVLLACEPTLLGHASLATTDVALTACLLALLLHFRLGRKGTWWRRVGVPGVWLGLAILAKASGLVFGMLGLAVLEFHHRLIEAEGDRIQRVREAARAVLGRAFRRDALQIGTLGLALAFAYCGSDWSVCPSFVKWARQLPDGPLGSAMVWLAEHLRVFSNAGVALARQVRHNVRGQDAFLLDEIYWRSVWYYFPVALSIKAALPLLVLPLVLAVLCPRALGNWPCAMALALFLFSLTCRVQIGIRLMLPLIALSLIGLAVALARARITLPPGWKRDTVGLGAGMGCCWMAWSALAVWPHGLCYTNELWGGTANGYRHLSDSNYDWGQGLPELVGWQQAHPEADLTVLYYGPDVALHVYPLRPLPRATLAQARPERLPPSLRGRTLAVSTSIVFGSLRNHPALTGLATALHEREPSDRTTTFLIYRFPPGPEKRMADRGPEGEEGSRDRE